MGPIIHLYNGTIQFFFCCSGTTNLSVKFKNKFNSYKKYLKYIF